MKPLRRFLLVMILGAFASGAVGDDHCKTYTGFIPDSIDKPYGAVGYIGNGCTATLIGPQHILTAAHCIVAEGDSSNYWTDIWFYPNYHSGDQNPPRFRIDRAVLGAHGHTGDE